MNETQLKGLQSIGYNSGIVDATNKAVEKKVSDPALDELLAGTGVSLDEVMGEAIPNKNEEVKKKLEELDKEPDKSWLTGAGEFALGVAKEAAMNPASPTLNKLATYDTLEGYGVAFRKLARNAWNATIDGVNYIETFAQSQGLTTKDLVSENQKWKKDEWLESIEPSRSVHSKVVEAATEFITPMAAAVASGGGLLLSAGVSGLYNFFGMDPKQENLANTLDGTSMSELPVAAEVIDYLKIDPNDSDLENRMKNVMLGFGFDATAGLAVYKTSKAYNKIGALKNTASKPMVPEMPQAKPVEVPVEQVVQSTKAQADALPQLSVEEEAKLMQEAFTIPGQGELTAPKPMDEWITKNNEMLKAGEETAEDMGWRFADSVEQVNPDPISAGTINGKEVTISKQGATIFATVEDAGTTKVVGHIRLQAEPLEDGTFAMTSNYTKVEREFGRQGLATQMYKYIDDNIGKIQQSQTQTPSGAMFTEARAAKQAEQELNAYKKLVEKKRADIVPESQVVDAEQLKLFDAEIKASRIEEPTIVTGANGPEINFNNPDAERSFFGVLQDAKTQTLIRESINDTELMKRGKALAADPKIQKQFTEWRPEMGPVPDEVAVAGVYIFSSMDDVVKATGAAVRANPNDEVLLARYAMELQGMTNARLIVAGRASEAGATLRTEQVIAAAAKTGNREALAIIGAQGRARLRQLRIEKAGGTDALQRTATGMGVLEDLAKIDAMPDTAFKKHMGEAIEMTKFDKLDRAVTRVAYNSMMSLLGTPLRAALSNATIAGFESLNKYVQVATHWGDDSVRLAEANAYTTAMVGSWTEALAASWNKIKSGQVDKTVRLELAEGLAKSPDDIIEQSPGVWAATKGIVAALPEGPSRVIAGVDTFWHTVTRNGVIAAEAERAIIRQGLKGAEADLFRMNFRKNPPPSVSNYATQVALERTFANDLTGASEEIAKGIDSFLGKIPIPGARTLIPFFKTSANMVEDLVERSPLAPMLSTDFKNAWRAGGRARNEALVRMSTGSTVIGTFVYLKQQGMITGRHSPNSDIHRAMQDNRTVAPEFSIKVGGTWTSVKGIEPLQTMLEVADNMSRAAGYFDEAEYWAMSKSLGHALGAIVTPEQLLDSTAGVLNLIAGKEDAQNFITSFPQRFVPLLATMGEAERLIDPTMRTASMGKAKGFKDLSEAMAMRIATRVPFFSENLPAQRNLWGEVLMLPDGLGPDFVSVMASTDDQGQALKETFEAMDSFYELNKETAAAVLDKLPIQMPSRYLHNGDTSYRLTPKEYGAYTMFMAGKNPDGTLYAKESLKTAVYRIMEDNQMLGKSPKEMNPTQYAIVNAQLAATFLAYAAAAEEGIKNFGPEGQTVGEKMANERKNTYNFIR